MATLTTQTIPAAGLTPAFEAADPAGDRLRPGRGVVFHARNGGETSMTVTLITPGTVQGLAIADRQVTVPAGAELLVPVPADLYGDPADGGYASVTYSVADDVTAAVIRN